VLTNKRMYRAFLLVGEPRYIYKVPNHEARDRLDAWLGPPAPSCNRSSSSRARSGKHKQGVLAAVELGLSIGRLEALAAG
jgi:transposase